MSCMHLTSDSLLCKYMFRTIETEGDEILAYAAKFGIRTISFGRLATPGLAEEGNDESERAGKVRALGIVL